MTISSNINYTFAFLEIIQYLQISNKPRSTMSKCRRECVTLNGGKLQLALHNSFTSHITFPFVLFFNLFFF